MSGAEITTTQCPHQYRLQLAAFIRRSAVALIAVHVGIWLFEAIHSGVGLGGVLDNWDAEYYINIAQNGYSGRLYAFFPLVPALNRLLAAITGTLDAPQFTAAALSLACFAGFVLLVAHAVAQGQTARGLLPRTRTGWLVFLLSPATYAFHYHGTEALFLLLSFGALYAAHRQRWLGASVFAGLSALTRAQGVFVAVAVGLTAALQSRGPGQRMSRFVLCGIISGALFALYPLYQYVTVGDPLAFVHAQRDWRQVDSIGAAIATLWFANPWQVGGVSALLHHALFFLLLGAAVALAVRRPRSVPLGLYVAASTFVVTFQGELANMFRFGTVLFSGLFVLGDAAHRLPRLVRAALLVGMLLLNLVWAWKYAHGLWPG